MSALADAITDVTQWLPRAAALTAEPDTAPTGPGGKPGSRPPWNSQAANALWDALAVIAETRAMFAYLVHGRVVQAYPYAATGAALEAIGRLGEAVPPDRARQAVRELLRAVHVIQVLPAIDREERWEKLRASADGQRPVCPHCGQDDLRVTVRAGLVACVTVDCADGDGNRPVASMMLGAISGTPMVVGADGTVWAVAP